MSNHGLPRLFSSLIIQSATKPIALFFGLHMSLNQKMQFIPKSRSVDINPRK